MVEYAGTGAAPGRVRRSEQRAAVSLLRSVDWILLSGVVGLVAFGLWAIGGITRFDVTGNEGYFVTRQAIFAALGCVGFLVASAVDPQLYRRFKVPIFAGTIGLMLLVFAAGTAVRGSTRWIDVGFFRFQPSEFGKLLLVLFLSAFLADRVRRIGEWRTVLAAVGLAALPALLVFRQPDFGTALVYGAVLIAVLFVAGARWTHLAALGAAGATAALAVVWWLPAMGVELLEPYQVDRLIAFTDRDRDPGGTTYNVTQSIVAVGSGGLRGRGVELEGSTQTTLAYLPEHATDFAFASLAEQRGFVGASALLLLYLLVLWRGLRIIPLARDPFSAMVAGGIVVALMFQIAVNVGMTMGMAPVTGIPLPFVSVGGSALIANLIAMGVLQAIHIRGRSDRRR
jgi:rod shape determining protein RodA